MQSSIQIITTNKPTSSFLQAGCPSCRTTNSVRALKGKISHSMDLLTSSSPGGLPTLSLTTNSSWLPRGRVAMPLISPLMPVPQAEAVCKQQDLTQTAYFLIQSNATILARGNFLMTHQLKTSVRRVITDLSSHCYFPATIIT